MWLVPTGTIVRTPIAHVKDTALGSEHDPNGAPSAASLHGRSGGWQNRIDRLPLCPTIVVINPVTLIMPANETSTNEVGHSPADVTTPRASYLLAQSFVDDLGGFLCIARKLLPAC